MNRSQLTLVARLHAEQRSRCEESQAFSEVHEALAKAEDAIALLTLERENERCLRLEAQLNATSVRHGREAAMRALRQAMHALREVRAEAAQRDGESQRLQALLETERRARG
ncbi:MAG TPA: hypothetical protein VGO84_13875, partial [Burkholderiales bacterium]|nr:hypothetical protein [Burkholderiales bacterium]